MQFSNVTKNNAVLATNTVDSSSVFNPYRSLKIIVAIIEGVAAINTVA